MNVLRVNIGKKKCKKAFCFSFALRENIVLYSFVYFQRIIFSAVPLPPAHHTQGWCGAIKRVTGFKMYKSLLNDVAKCGRICLLPAIDYLIYRIFIWFVQNRNTCTVNIKNMEFYHFLCDFLSRIM